MKKTYAGIALAAAAAMFFYEARPEADEKAKHKFMGVANCKMCHQKKEDGEQFKQWKESKHAKAYETLASDKAKEIAKKKGIDDPQKSPQCLKCHTTGHGASAELFDKKFVLADGVQCESCHGAGGDYWKKEVMKDREKSIANGLILPDEKMCKTCHNQESPTYEEFKFDEFLKKVQHPKPKK